MLIQYPLFLRGATLMTLFEDNMDQSNLNTAVAAKRPRDRNQTEADILEAVTRVLARDGFTKLGINAIAREANIDKVLIYRYFGGMPQLLQAFGTHGHFWPTIPELLGDLDLTTLSLSQRVSVFLDRFIDALRNRPLTIEILAMEIGTPNELTAILDITREKWGQAIAEHLAGDEITNENYLTINISILIAGIQYMLLRARHTMIFNQIPIQDNDGWITIKESLSWLCDRMLNPEIKP